MGDDEDIYYAVVDNDCGCRGRLRLTITCRLTSPMNRWRQPTSEPRAVLPITMWTMTVMYTVRRKRYRCMYWWYTVQETGHCRWWCASRQSSSSVLSAAVVIVRRSSHVYRRFPASFSNSDVRRRLLLYYCKYYYYLLHCRLYRYPMTG